MESRYSSTAMKGAMCDPAIDAVPDDHVDEVDEQHFGAVGFAQRPARHVGRATSTFVGCRPVRIIEIVKERARF